MDEALKTFVDLIAKAEHVPEEHQYILKPVSGSGKIKLNKRYGGDVPKAGVTLNFDELGFVVDDEQYKNVLLMMGLFHAFMRQHEVSLVLYIGVFILLTDEGELKTLHLQTVYDDCMFL